MGHNFSKWHKEILSFIFTSRDYPKTYIIPLWLTDPLLQTSVLNHFVLQNCFQMILQFVHSADSTFFGPKDPNRDRLHKVQPIVNYLVDKFKFLYVPSKYISIAEELLLWKGWLIFEQYIPDKRA